MIRWFDDARHSRWRIRLRRLARYAWNCLALIGAFALLLALRLLAGVP